MSRSLALPAPAPAPGARSSCGSSCCSRSRDAGKQDHELVDDFRLPNSEAQQAADRLEEVVPRPVRRQCDRRARRRARHIRREANAAAIRMRSPVREARSRGFGVDPLAAGNISSTGEIGFAEVRYDRDVVELGKDDFEALEGTVGALPTVACRPRWAAHGRHQGEQPRTSSEQIGLLIAVVVLLFAFARSSMMALPIGASASALAVGADLVLVLAAATNVPTSASTLAAMIGLGVGIDFSLFIVTRFEKPAPRGASVVEAAGQASTAGSAVLFAAHRS